MSDAPSVEKGLPACEVHVPGRDEPSPWCAACRMSGAAPMPDAEKDARCPKCGGALHRLSERFYRCDLAHLTRVLPPGGSDA